MSSAIRLCIIISHWRHTFCKKDAWRRLYHYAGSIPGVFWNFLSSIWWRSKRSQNSLNLWSQLNFFAIQRLLFNILCLYKRWSKTLVMGENIYITALPICFYSCRWNMAKELVVFYSSLLFLGKFSGQLQFYQLLVSLQAMMKSSIELYASKKSSILFIKKKECRKWLPYGIFAIIQFQEQHYQSFSPSIWHYQ